MAIEQSSAHVGYINSYQNQMSPSVYAANNDAYSGFIKSLKSDDVVSDMPPRKPHGNIGNNIDVTV